MGNTKNNMDPGDEEISPLKKLIHQKNNETKALKKLLKALEEDENNKTNINPDSYRNQTNEK